MLQLADMWSFQVCTELCVRFIRCYVLDLVALRLLLSWKVTELPTYKSVELNSPQTHLCRHRGAFSRHLSVTVRVYVDRDVMSRCGAVRGNSG